MRHLRVRLIIAALLVFILILAGCGNKETTSSQSNKAAEDKEKLHIVTTFYPMYEFTKNIVKDKAEVELLIPANMEPHDWEPTPKDMAAIQKADVFVYNSRHFETWVSQVQESLADEQVVFIEAGKGISLSKKEGADHDHGEEGEHHEEESHEDGTVRLDPHIWLSPVLAQEQVQAIEAALAEQDPKNKDSYESNSETYIGELQELDELYRNTLRDKRSKEFITQHAAFGYLAKEYGLTQLSIAGISPSEEPSPAKLAQLKHFAEEHGIKVIYFEKTASPKIAQTLADEIGAETEVLNTLEGLSEKEQKQGLNYIEVMKQNLKALEKYLVQ